MPSFFFCVQADKNQRNFCLVLVIVFAIWPNSTFSRPGELAGVTKVFHAQS